MYLLIARLLIVLVIDSLDQLTNEFSLKQYLPVPEQGSLDGMLTKSFHLSAIRRARHVTCEHKQRMFEDIVAVKKFWNYLNLRIG